MRYINGSARSHKTRAEQEEADFVAFIADVIRPAYSEIGRELSQKGRTVTIHETRAACAISVMSDKTLEITFRIMSLSMPTGTVPNIEVKMHERKGLKVQTRTFPLRGTSEERRTIADTQQEDIVECFFKHYNDAIENLK